MSAWDLVQQAIGNKQQYETYLQQNPTATESNSSTLAGLHQADLSIESQLNAMGFADAAQAMISDNAAGLSQWASAHQTYLQGGGSGGGNVVPGGGQPPILPPSVGTPTTIGGDAQAVGAGIASFFQGIGTFFANPGGWFQTLGQGLGAGASAAGQGVGGAFQTVGQGIGGGASAAGTGAGQGAINAKPLIIAGAAILGLLWLNKGVRIRENRTSVRHSEGRGLFGYKP